MRLVFAYSQLFVVVFVSERFGLFLLSTVLVGDCDHSFVELLAMHARRGRVQLVRFFLNGASVDLPEVVVLATV